MQTYRDTEKSLQQKWRKTVIEKKQKKEHFVIWGGGAKAVAFLNQIDAGKNYIDKVIDINPVKQGNFLPGTGHQIVGPTYLQQIKGKINLLVMNENYLDEIKKCVKEMGIENKNMEFLLLR